MEVEGKAIEIEAGKTYAIEVESQFNPDVARAYAQRFEQETGAKFIFISGGKLARSNEQDLRDEIAKDLEKERIWPECPTTQCGCRQRNEVLDLAIGIVRNGDE